MLRVIAIVILVFLVIRFLLKLFMPSSPSGRNQRSRQDGHTTEKHREGDVIIEYKKQPRRKPKPDADDVDYEIIE